MYIFIEFSEFVFTKLIYLEVNKIKCACFISPPPKGIHYKFKNKYCMFLRFYPSMLNIINFPMFKVVSDLLESTNFKFVKYICMFIIAQTCVCHSWRELVYSFKKAKYSSYWGKLWLAVTVLTCVWRDLNQPSC